MREAWPLWWHLEPAAQALLMQFQWDTYGCRLEIPPEPGHGHIDAEIESLEEIDRGMRRPPRHQRRVT